MIKGVNLLTGLFVTESNKLWQQIASSNSMSLLSNIFLEALQFGNHIRLKFVEPLMDKFPVKDLQIKANFDDRNKFISVTYAIKFVHEDVSGIIFDLIYEDSKYTKLKVYVQVKHDIHSNSL